MNSIKLFCLIQTVALLQQKLFIGSFWEDADMAPLRLPALRGAPVASVFGTPRHGPWGTVGGGGGGLRAGTLDLKIGRGDYTAARRTGTHNTKEHMV